MCNRPAHSQPIPPSILRLDFQPYALDQAKAQFADAMLTLAQVERALFIQDDSPRPQLTELNLGTVASKEELVELVSDALQTQVRRLRDSLAGSGSGGSDRLDCIFQQITRMIQDYRERKVELDPLALLNCLRQYIRGLQRRGNDLLSKLQGRFVTERSRDLTDLRDELLRLQSFIKLKLNAAFDLAHGLGQQFPAALHSVNRLKQIIGSVFEETQACVTHSRPSGYQSDQPQDRVTGMPFQPCFSRSYIELDSKQSRAESLRQSLGRKQADLVASTLQAKRQVQLQRDSAIQRASAFQAEISRLRLLVQQQETRLKQALLNDEDLKQLGLQLNQLRQIKQEWVLLKGQGQNWSREKRELNKKNAQLESKLKESQESCKKLQHRCRQSQQLARQLMAKQDSNHPGADQLRAQLQQQQRRNRDLEAGSRVLAFKIKELESIIMRQ